MATPENTELCDFTSTNNDDFICTPIAPPAPEVAFYEIKPALLNLVMKEQFSGISTEDVASHLNNFFELCEMQKYKDINGDIIKLKLFPFSLRGSVVVVSWQMPWDVYMWGLGTLEVPGRELARARAYTNTKFTQVQGPRDEVKPLLLPV